MNPKTRELTRRKELLYACFCTLLCLVCVISICYADFEHGKRYALEDTVARRAKERCIRHIDQIGRSLYLACTCYGDKNYNSTVDSLLTECGSVSGICSVSKGDFFEKLEKYCNALHKKLSQLPRTLSPETRAFCGELRLINDALSDCLEKDPDFSRHIEALERLSVPGSAKT